MREICTCGSEGGAAQANAPFLPLCHLPARCMLILHDTAVFPN